MMFQNIRTGLRTSRVERNFLFLLLSLIDTSDNKRNKSCTQLNSSVNRAQMGMIPTTSPHNDYVTIKRTEK